LKTKFENVALAFITSHTLYCYDN